MKIEFPDKSYVDCQKSINPGKIMITIAAKDHDNPLKKIVNSVELTIDDFKRMIADVS